MKICHVTTVNKRLNAINRFVDIEMHLQKCLTFGVHFILAWRFCVLRKRQQLRLLCGKKPNYAKGLCLKVANYAIRTLCKAVLLFDFANAYW